MSDTTSAATVPVGPVPASRVQLGVIGRAHGVRGLVKVTSHTSDPAALTGYGPLFDAAGRCYVLRWKAEGVAEVSRMVDGAAVKVGDRSAAEKLTNTPLFVDRSALPPAGEDEYYLSDLIGLVAADPAGTAIGKVSFVHDYGAGASLEIQRSADAPLLIPFTAACVPAVDLVGGRLVVVLPDEIVVPGDADIVVPGDADIVVPGDADIVVPGDADGFAPERAGILAPASVKDAQA